VRAERKAGAGTHTPWWYGIYSKKPLKGFSQRTKQLGIYFRKITLATVRMDSKGDRQGKANTENWEGAAREAGRKKGENVHRSLKKTVFQ